MRSSRSRPDPLDPGPLGFAHRGLHFGSAVPENSLEAFHEALELGAGIECDLRLTADDRIVLFHDANTQRLCASPLRIGRSGWQDIAGLRVGGHSIPTLDSLLELVAGRVPLLLEVKVERDRLRWIPALTRELAGYRGRFGVMSFDRRFVRLLAREMPVRRGLVMSDRLSFVERRVSIRIAKPEFLAVESTALGQGWVARARGVMPVYGWTIRTREQRAQAAVQADALIWEADGRPRI
jgi:glycerophosphoryl diester phosphodiesterase